MLTIYVDADACPVKDEIAKVALRYGLPVKVVANNSMRVPSGPLVELVVKPGFGAVDDWIAEQVGPGDIVITSDIPLAARSLERGALALDDRGQAFSESDIGQAMAMRDLMRGLRADGSVSGGPPPMTPKDRSRFLGKLDQAIVAVQKKFRAS